MTDADILSIVLLLLLLPVSAEIHFNPDNQTLLGTWDDGTIAHISCSNWNDTDTIMMTNWVVYYQNKTGHINLTDVHERVHDLGVEVIS